MVVHARESPAQKDLRESRCDVVLCGLHKVCSHVVALSDLFIYLSTRVERLSRGLVSYGVISLSQPSWL